MDSNFQVKITADISNLQNSLKSVEQTLGTFKKTTDDASTGMSRMNNEASRGRLVAFAFGQVIRDAGFFANDFGLGLLAISNNIPILIDQLVMLSNVSKGLGAAISIAGSVITAALTVVAYTMMYSKKATEEFNKELAKSTGEANKNALMLTTLISIAKDETLSMKQRQDAVNRINAEYKEFNGNLTVAGASSQKTTELVDRLTKSMLLNAQATALANAYSKASGELFQLQNTPLAEQAGLLDKVKVYWKSFLDFINPFTGSNNPIKDFTDGARAGLNKFGLDSFNTKSKELKATMSGLEQQLRGVLTQLTALGLTSQKTKNSTNSVNQATRENIDLLAKSVSVTQQNNAVQSQGVVVYKNLSQAVNSFQEQQKQANEYVRFIVQTIGGDLVNAFNTMLETGTLSFNGVIKAIGSMIKKLIAAAMAAALLSAILGPLFGKSNNTNFMSIFGMLSGLNLNAGAPVPNAKGGIYSGPTNTLVGEYPGARSNPEVIAPLDRLKSLIGNAGGDMGSGGYIAETRISGNDLAILIRRATRNRSVNFG